MITKVISFIVFVTVVAAQEPTALTPIVQTESGPVRGQIAFTRGDGKPFYIFQGIPYAEPPVGELRLKDTVKKQPWKSVLNAIEEPPQCVQGTNPVTGQEDCLFLNINTPTLKKNHLPVLVIVHGGGFIVGNASRSSIVPDRMLDRNIIVVTLQYRLGFFGFASTNDLSLPGNYGLKDQRVALEWIRENICHFGGDPEKITLMGQSAGAASVHYQTLSSSKKNLFRSVIMESGNSLTLWALDREPRDKIFKIASQLGIKTNNTKELVEELRQQEVADLQKTAMLVGLQNQLNYILSGTTFAPVMEPYYDGAIVHRNSYKLLRSGKYSNNISTLMGVNSNELSILQQIPFVLRIYLLKYINDPSSLTPVDLTDDPVKRKAAGQEIIDYYFDGKNPMFNDSAIFRFGSDDTFNRAIGQCAELQADHGPVYLYRFSYEGAMGGVTKRYQKGVGHTEELQYMFGPMKSTNNTSFSEEDLNMSDRMVTMWSNFIKTGNPTPTEDPLLQNITWAAVDKDSNDTQFLEINSKMEMSTNFYRDMINFYKKLYAKYQNKKYDIY